MSCTTFYTYKTKTKGTILYERSRPSTGEIDSSKWLFLIKIKEGSIAYTYAQFKYQSLLLTSILALLKLGF